MIQFDHSKYPWITGSLDLELFLLDLSSPNDSMGRVYFTYIYHTFQPNVGKHQPNVDKHQPNVGKNQPHVGRYTSLMDPMGS